MRRFKLQTFPQPNSRKRGTWANIPFPKGMLFSEKNVYIKSECGKKNYPTTNALTRWHDQSLQWVELAWNGCTCCDTHWVSTIENGPPTQTKHLHCNPLDHMVLSIVVELDCGKTLELQPNRTLIDQTQTTLNELDMIDARGVVHCRCLIQVKPLPDTGCQAWTIILRNHKLASHAGGIWELGDPKSLRIKRGSVRLNLHKDTTNAAKSLVKPDVKSEWSNQHEQEWRLEQLGSGEDCQSSIHRNPFGTGRDRKIGYHFYFLDKDVQGRRATPSAVIERGGERALGIHCKNFWQKFPQSLTVKPDSSLHYDFLPYTHNEAHEVQGGEQISCEFLLAQGAATKVQSFLDGYAQLQTLNVDPEWITKSRVIPWLTPRKEDDQQSYLALVDQAITGPQSFFAKREQIGQYGWRHFGDVWGDHEAIHSSPDEPLVSHYNNQYDMVLGLGINYLRSGDPRWFELMRDLARHVIDIDIYHTDEDLACYNHGMFWHTVHYVDAGLSTHRSYPKGTCGGGPSSGHAYNRGLYLYYCLTGDLTAKEAVINMGEWMIASEDGSKTKYRYLAGGETGLTTASGTEDYHGPGRGPANCVEVLVTAFEATHDRKYLTQAEHIIRRVVHPEQDIEALDLLDSENKWFYLMFLQALGRYLEVKISLEEIDDMYSYAKITLLRFADWMAEHEYPFLDKPEKLEFPTETWAAQDMRKTEVFQWAARHGSEHQKQIFLEKASFFFNESVHRLNGFETKSLCRPIALLLTNGYSHDFFASGQLDKMTPSPPPSVTTFAPQKTFRSQKMRAIRNAKIILGCIGFLAILLMAMIITILLRG
jgi:hypothetical protein